MECSRRIYEHGIDIRERKKTAEGRGRRSLQSGQLRARRHRLDMLVYLLDMAHLEAEEIVRLGSSGNSHSTG